MTLADDQSFKLVRGFIKHGDIITVRRLLDQGLHPDLTDTSEFETLLMVTASEGHVPLGELLLSRGATVNWSNSYGQSAFSFAILNIKIAFVKLLLDHGATPDSGLEGWLPRVGYSPKQIEAVLGMIRDADANRTGS